MTIDWKREWAELGIIAAVSVPFLFWGLGSFDLLDPDEGLYGSIALAMAESGDWITPRFNGVRYLEKPPLYFWLTALTIRAFGPAEWAVRLWSAAPALGAALITWRLGKILYGGTAGVAAAIILVTGVGVARYSLVAATDMLLVFSLTLSMYGFVKAALSQWSTVNSQQDPHPNPLPGREREGRGLMVNGQWGGGGGTIDELRLTIDQAAGPVLFWLGCALGVLAKGLIGLVFPLLIVGLFLLVNGKWQMASGRAADGEWRMANWRGGGGLFAICYSLFAHPVGWLIFAVVTLPWHVLAGLKNPGFFQFYLVDNQFLRFLNQRAFLEDDIPVSTARFLILLLVWFFPWSLYLLPASPHGFAGSGSSSNVSARLRLVVGLWALVVVGFFSLSNSKLEHYFLPAVPPLALAVGALWAQVMVKGQQSTVNSQQDPHPNPLPGRERGGRGLMVNGRWGGGGGTIDDLRLTIDQLLMPWCAAASAAGCALFGAGLIVFSGRLSEGAVFAGLAELNVYYRILMEEGIQFPFTNIDMFAGLVWVLGWSLLLGLPLSFLFLRMGRPRLSFAAVVGVAAVISGLVFKLILVMEPHHSAKEAASAILRVAASDDVLVHEGSLEYSASLPYYTGRNWAVLDGRQGDLEFGSRYPESRELFVDGADFERLWRGPKRVFVLTRLPGERSLVSKLPGETVFTVGVYGPRWVYANRPVTNW